MTDKPKFKQTEVGLIPSDWEVKTLGSLTDKCSYGVGAEARVYCGDVKYIRITDIDDESHRFSPSPITSPSFFQEKHIVQKNDLLVARTGASVGKSYLYDEKDGKLVYAGFLMKLNIFNADSKYVFYNTLTKSYWNWVASESARTGQPGLNLQQMKLYSIALPPTIEEQQRIANALSDVDTLINNLEKLIAKKKNIKQGTMQQLLTGRKRLPGFGSDNGHTDWFTPNGVHEKTIKTAKVVRPESIRVNDKEQCAGFKMTELGLIPSDWEFVPVSELAKDMADGPFGSNLKKEHYTSNPQTRIIQLSNIGENGWEDENTKYTTFEHAKTIARCIVPKEESILVAKMMPAGRAIICPKKEKQYVLGSDVIRITANEKLNSKYFVYASKSDAYLKQISDNTQGSTRQRTSISKLRKILILLPSLAEQTAIANVLSDMDTEISALETKLAKYRTLKTGMMQQLLTGKIRLLNAKSETKSAENNRVVPIAFKRAVLAAEIAHRLCAEPTFGYVKMEKMLFLAEKMCELDINSSYHRDAAGPYDNRALRSVDSQLEKQKWFKFIRSDKGNHYIPLEKRGGHSQYFDRYYSECRSVFDNIINTFKTAKTEQCEIVATLYSAWEDFLNHGTNPTDDQIVTEVLTNWNESKKRISKERWIKALLWMKENSFVPRRT